MEKTRWIMALAVALSGMGLAGCPPLTAPFDTTGDYAGTWSGTAQDQAGEGEADKQAAPAPPQQVLDCPLAMTLTQDVDAPSPGNLAVQGVVTVDFSCVELPERFETPPPSVVNVSGVQQENGKLTLLSGGCGAGFCVVLSLDGQGADTDEDGLMDQYDGTWTWVLALAGVQPFGATGAFALDVAE